MPRSLEPGERLELILESDRDKPDATVFYAHSLAFRTHKRLANCVRALTTKEADADEKLVDMVASLITGWNRSEPYTATSIEETCNLTEIVQLAGLIMLDGRMEIADRKKSESQALLEPENSVTDAAVDAEVSSQANS